MPSIKLTPADIAFSMCVRERAGNVCEICGSPNAQCCHYEGRGNWATRFEPLNCFSFCYGHHSYMDGHRFEFDAYFLEHRGENALATVRKLAINIALQKQIHQTHGKGEIAQHFKDELKKMLEGRSYGVTHWIDFERYNP